MERLAMVGMLLVECLIKFGKSKESGFS